mmetsp:Transcript_30898/g.61594  ORF Transcript_30898/g.61594 Transcript_30898/m.61594 type:complete len:210 (-) Transcript_30898:103-732(-)
MHVVLAYDIAATTYATCTEATSFTASSSIGCPVPSQRQPQTNSCQTQTTQYEKYRCEKDAFLSARLTIDEARNGGKEPIAVDGSIISGDGRMTPCVVGIPFVADGLSIPGISTGRPSCTVGGSTCTRRGSMDIHFKMIRLVVMMRRWRAVSHGGVTGDGAFFVVSGVERAFERTVVDGIGIVVADDNAAGGDVVVDFVVDIPMDLQVAW